MDIMIAVQDACVSGQWLTAIILSLCCFLPSCLPAGQTVDYPSSESVVSRQGDTALLRLTRYQISFFVPQVLDTHSTLKLESIQTCAVHLNSNPIISSYHIQC
ncbi:Neuronal growth regulator 1 [Anabarilius grahami]|uniref:Neuronal growth regulator 1 n=1 Tax=Anabarilius grahami TaxID=495550 RepID=A0A3N0YE35_ANAGA|nr:Neuronal growth regulator 1 [Anabarilius grahami]